MAEEMVTFGSPKVQHVITDNASAGGGGASTIADGADVAEGSTTDAAVAAGATGTVSAKLRRLTTDLDAAKTNQTNGSQKSQIVDGSGNVIGSTSNALDVNIKSGASSGTQYTEADTDATITGTAIMWEDTADTLRSVSAAKPLPIGDAGGSLTVDAPVGTPVFVRLSDGAAAISALPITDNSGSITVDNAGTFAVQAAAVDGSASGNITTQNLVPAGTATAGSAVELTVTGHGVVNIQVTGTYTGALSLQYTVDGSTWVTNSSLTFINVNTGAVTTTIASAATGIFMADCAGFTKVRVTALAAVTGTAVVTMKASVTGGIVALDQPLPTGTNTIGAVNIAASQTLATVTNVATIGTSVTPGTAAANLGKARDSAIGATDTGVAMLGVRRDAPTAETPVAGDYVVPQYSANGTQWVTPTPDAGATGLTMFRNTALSNTAVAVKASAGRVYNYHFYNSNTSDAFVQFYNTAQGSVTVGTTTPVKTFAVPAGGVIDGVWAFSPAFSTAITVAATTTIAGGSAPSTGLLVNLDYI